LDTVTFQGDPPGVALSLCLPVDGLNPWSKNKTNYSTWPIVLGQLNLPRRIRYHFANLILVGIIPSQVQGAEPKDLYLEVLVDEIIYLSGCKPYDAYRRAPFNMKVEVLIYILDYQGLGKVFSLTRTGSKRGCAWCLFIEEYCKHLNKVVYRYGKPNVAIFNITIFI